jgi:hypothetical protein
MLGRIKALLQFREVVLVHRGLSAKAGDESLLAVISLAHDADVALTGSGVPVEEDYWFLLELTSGKVSKSSASIPGTRRPSKPLGCRSSV